MGLLHTAVCLLNVLLWKYAQHVLGRERNVKNEFSMKQNNSTLAVFRGKQLQSCVDHVCIIFAIK